MEIFPAIDLKDGKVVRLTRGDYNCVDVYSENPVEVALELKSKGAKNLHVVDLDGARDGKLSNFTTIKSIIKATGMFVQIGGGIRDEKRIEQYLNIGASRLILGTVAIENFEFLQQMIAKYADKIAVGVDANKGKIAIKGWREVTDVDSLEFCKTLERASVATIIYTDIEKDGAMQGTNLYIYNKLTNEISCNIIASGGITSMSEIKELNESKIYGAILGKALYQGALSLEEVLTQCK